MLIQEYFIFILFVFIFYWLVVILLLGCAGQKPSRVLGMGGSVSFDMFAKAASDDSDTDRCIYILSIII
jgi:hypothetical protein